jgi:hypothetical protein
MRIGQDWREKILTHSPVWWEFFSLSLTLSIFLASCFLTWRVGECLENLIHTADWVDENVWRLKSCVLLTADGGRHQFTLTQLSPNNGNEAFGVRTSAGGDGTSSGTNAELYLRRKLDYDTTPGDRVRIKHISCWTLELTWLDSFSKSNMISSLS